MARHISTGKLGEHLAVDFLNKKGFTILHRNWRHKHWEVDIIASLQDVVHFVEVKTRRTDKYGYPEEGVSRKKLLNVMAAAEEFQYQHPEWKKIQFDILSVFIDSGDKESYLFIEDVYV